MTYPGTTHKTKLPDILDMTIETMLANYFEK